MLFSPTCLDTGRYGTQKKEKANFADRLRAWGRHRWRYLAHLRFRLSEHNQ